MEWRIVPSFPGLEVSDTGLAKRRSTGYVSNGVNGSGGYRYIKVSKRRQVLLHRLIAEAFHGPAPFPGALVRHLDGNPANNVLANIAWGTAKDNKADSLRLGETPVGERASNAILTTEIVMRLRREYAAGTNMRRLCRLEGLPFHAAYAAATKRTWKHL